MNSDRPSGRPTPIGERHYRDTKEAPPPDFDDEPTRETILPPPESAVIVRPRGFATSPQR